MGIMDDAKNKGEEFSGKAKESVGDAVGNDDLKREGKADQVESKFKQAGDKVKDAANDIKDSFDK